MVDDPHLPILLVMGLAVVLGTAGARVFQRFRIPQVVGYIVIGVALGVTGFQVINADTAERLRPFNYFALGMIGFMIGGELHRDVFRRYGRQLVAVMVAEGLGSFAVVAAAGSVVVYLLTGQPALSLALGLLLGAISSATAPAATVDVLWEYKTRGPLTTTVFALVALDDGLALLLFAVASSVAAGLLQHSDLPLASALIQAVYELAGAVALGVLAGLILNWALRRLHERGKALAFILGALALVIGLARLLHLDLILAAMALGATLTNLAPRRSHRAFELVESFSAPIYALFFVMVGARLDVLGMPAWVWGLALVYVAGRSGGKMLGAWAGARWTGAADAVRRNLGLCLFSQAGVAIGLAILSADRFAGAAPDAPFALDAVIISVVTASTFLVQLFGPSCVKWAVTRAGEVGLNITEEDLAATYRARDLAETPVAFREDTPLAEVLGVMAETEALAYPVTDEDGTLTGVITMEDFRKSFQAQRISHWLLADDVMQTPPDPAIADLPLPEAMDLMRDQGLDYLPVVDGPDTRRLTGLLQRHGVRRTLASEILRRSQLADAAENAPAPARSAP